MEAQLAARRSRLDAGDRPLGWKVGFGAPSAMDALGTDRPLVGHLMRAGLRGSGSEVRLSEFTRLAIEPEIAVYLGADLDSGNDRAAIQATISGLGPAIEIVDVLFPPAGGAEKILAANIFQQGVVLGPVDESRAGARLDGLSASVRCNGTDVDTPHDLESNTGPILEVVAVVADTLAAMGERLRAGELIIMGSIVPPLVPEAEANIEFTLGNAEPISIRVV